MPANVLLVLEDGDLRSRLIEALTETGCQVLPVRSAHSALIVLRQFPGSLELLIASEDLAGMSGSQLGRVATRERADLNVLVVKGTLEQILQDVQAALREPAQVRTQWGTHRVGG